MKKGKRAIRTVAFLAVLLLSICVIQIPLAVDYADNYRRIRGFYSEEKNSLDGVYIGASNVIEFWQPVIGWMTRGIAVYGLSTTGMPMTGIEYMVREARKTQPNALYIFNLNNFKYAKPSASVVAIHKMTNYMPLSLNKIRLINAVSEETGLSWGKRLEFYFPIIQFHSRWSQLESWSYRNDDPQYKYFRMTDRFLYKTTDISEKYKNRHGRKELDEGVAQRFTDLLDYLDREHVNALFIKVPQAMDKDAACRMNTLGDIVEQRGYPCLDLTERIDEIGLDLHRDFIDKGHTNIYGSWKVSQYIADYLVEHYGFSDKRGQAAFVHWDRAAETFREITDEAAKVYGDAGGVFNKTPGADDEYDGGDEGGNEA